MVLARPRSAGGWTVADLDQLPDDGLRYELVDGRLVVTPPPGQRHQRRAATLRDLLAGAAPRDWECHVEWPLVLAHDTQRLADVAVHRWPARHPTQAARNPVGPADVGLVVEVVSPSSRRTDRVAKPGEYAAAGIALFWRLETEPGLVLFGFVLEQGRYVEVARVDGRGELPVPWGRLTVDVAALDA